MKNIILSAVLVLATASFPLFSQVGQDLKDAGSDTKKAVKTGADKTATGTKKAYSATKKGVKKGANKAATETEKGAHKVANKTSTSTAK
jgi:hypothetical protein